MNNFIDNLSNINQDRLVGLIIGLAIFGTLIAIALIGSIWKDRNNF